MKRNILLSFALLVALGAEALAQFSYPIRIREVDGSPNQLASVIQVSNGTLSCSGSTCTITTGGGGGGTSIGGAVTGGTAGSVLFVDTGPVLAQDNANLFYDNPNNRLALRTTTSYGTLTINQGVGDSTNNPWAYFGPTEANFTADQIDAFKYSGLQVTVKNSDSVGDVTAAIAGINVSNNADNYIWGAYLSAWGEYTSGTDHQVIGVQAVAAHNTDVGTQNAGEVIGIYAYADLRKGGNVTTSWGGYFQPSVNKTSGTVTNLIGVGAGAFRSAGTVTNAIGLQIDDIATDAAGSTNIFAIQTLGTAISQFGGRIITPGISDTNKNEVLTFTATASAVNEFSVANAVTGNSPTLSATGGDSVINPKLLAKGATGTLLVESTATLGSGAAGGGMLLNSQAAAGGSGTDGRFRIGYFNFSGSTYYPAMWGGTEAASPTTGNYFIQYGNDDDAYVVFNGPSTTGKIIFRTNNSNAPNAMSIRSANDGQVIGVNIAVGSVAAQFHAASGSASRVGLRVDSAASPTSAIAQFTNNGSSRVTIQPDSSIDQSGVTHANLGTPGNGRHVYCSDCAVTSGADNTCASGGSGAFAIRLNGVWRCFAAQN